MPFICPHCYHAFDKKSNLTAHLNKKTPCVKKAQLPTPTQNQQEIINALNDGYNVSVNAVAGSGKTTTALLIASANPEKNILLLTFNYRLAKESSKKVQKYNIKNITVSTYHAFSKNYYLPDFHTDQGIITALEKNTQPMENINFDIIMLDEHQDCKKLLFTFSCKIMTDNKVQSLVCCFGDWRQNIYKFLMSDSRYLTMANKILNNSKEWVKRSLPVSYRLTPKVTKFLNKVILDNDVITSGNRANKDITPEYHIIDMFDEKQLKIWVSDFKDMVKHNKYQWGDIFILCTSIPKKKCSNKAPPIVLLENMLTEDGIPCLVTTNAEERLDDRLINGKLVFTTFHQSKGLERKIIVVVGMDSFFYKYRHNSKEPMASCPNAFYVALTRSQERLIMLHNNRSDYLPFINKEELNNYCKIKKYNEVIVSNKDRFKRGDEVFDCTDFCTFVNESWLKDFNKDIEIEEYSKSNSELVSEILIDPKKDSYINVSDIIGIAIVQLALLKSYNRLDIYTDIIEYIKDNPTLTKKIKDNGPIPSYVDIEKILKLSNQYLSYVRHGYKFKLKQIKEYNFVKQSYADILVERIIEQIPSDATIETEVPITYVTKRPLLGYDHIINGRIDIVDKINKTVWEIKCKNEITSSDILQLIVYAVAFSQQNDGYKFKIFNVTTGEIRELKYNKLHKKYLDDIILNKKYCYPDEINDMTFVETNFRTIDIERPILEIDYEDEDEDEDEDKDKDKDKDKDEKQILFFDTETTGFGANDRIVTICWQIYKNKILIKSEYHIIKPLDFIINDKSRATEINKITQKIAQEQGIPIKRVFEILEKDLDKVNLKVAHNISFDKRMIRQELVKCRLTKLLDKFLQINEECTLKIGKMGLGKLYRHLFNDELNFHNAKDDTKACASCYFKLKNL